MDSGGRGLPARLLYRVQEHVRPHRKVPDAHLTREGERPGAADACGEQVRQGVRARGVASRGADDGAQAELPDDRDVRKDVRQRRARLFRRRARDPPPARGHAGRAGGRCGRRSGLGRSPPRWKETALRYRLSRPTDSLSLRPPSSPTQPNLLFLDLQRPLAGFATDLVFSPCSIYPPSPSALLPLARPRRRCIPPPFLHRHVTTPPRPRLEATKHHQQRSSRRRMKKEKEDATTTTRRPSSHPTPHPPCNCLRPRSETPCLR